MKATGIVRRIDDLGRIVIPKEIRRILHIREGDPLEIYIAYGRKRDFEKVFTGGRDGCVYGGIGALDEQCAGAECPDL